MRFTFFLFGYFLILSVSGQPDCDLRKSQDSIFVYACKTTDSNLKSIQAKFIVETTPSILAGHLLDVDHYASWQYRMIRTKVLKRVNERQVIYWGEVQAPWPISNRDLVVTLSIEQDIETKVMKFSIITLPNYYPEKSGIVRVPLSEGHWVVTPVGKNKLEVDYTFLVNPGGAIPGWLINLTIAEGPYQTFKNLKSRIESGAPVKRASFIKD